MAREFIAADADTDPRAALCSTLLRAGPLAMGRPRRSADELVLPLAVCLHRISEWSSRMSLPVVLGLCLAPWHWAHRGSMHHRSLDHTGSGLRVYCSNSQDAHSEVDRHLARNSALCRVIEFLLRSKDAFALGSESKLLAPRPVIGRRFAPPAHRHDPLLRLNCSPCNRARLIDARLTTNAAQPTSECGLCLSGACMEMLSTLTQMHGAPSCFRSSELEFRELDSPRTGCSMLLRLRGTAAPAFQSTGSTGSSATQEHLSLISRSL